jgi:hypothetical protein
MSTLRRLPKQGPYGPQKHKLTHVVRRAARSNRNWQGFPISTLPLRKTLCLPHSGVKPGSMWLWFGANALVGTAVGGTTLTLRMAAIAHRLLNVLIPDCILRPVTLHWFRRIMISLGWLLTTFFVAGLAGILKAG